MTSLNDLLWNSETIQDDDYLYANSCCLVIAVRSA